MKCGKCGKKMLSKTEVKLGTPIHIDECPSCGKKLVDYDDATKLQKMVLHQVVPNFGI